MDFLGLLQVMFELYMGHPRVMLELCLDRAKAMLCPFDMGMLKFGIPICSNFVTL